MKKICLDLNNKITGGKVFVSSFFMINDRVDFNSLVNFSFFLRKMSFIYLTGQKRITEGTVP